MSETSNADFSKSTAQNLKIISDLESAWNIAEEWMVEKCFVYLKQDWKIDSYAVSETSDADFSKSTTWNENIIWYLDSA